MKKIVLITGTSSGFGLLTSAVLARKGYHVIATMRDLSKQDRLLEAAGDAQDRIECMTLDVTNHDEIDEVVKSVIEKHGAIDLLVNNAGYAEGGFVEEVPMEKWRNQFETNFFGTLAMTKAVVPYMRERGKGTIINVSSISGRMALPGLGPYSASKFALEGFSESLRFELLPLGIHVVLVEPGSYKTPIWKKGVEAVSVTETSAYHEKTKKLVGVVRHIEKTAGDPQEVADLICKIAQEARPAFRRPLGKGVKATLRARDFLPWRWLERAVVKRMH
ncbi:MAG TPA: SDR family oxidoreductase [Bacillales bacterium]|nr:SDR family oxidoreductase [Bacillales bacterium]